MKKILIYLLIIISLFAAIYFINQQANRVNQVDTSYNPYGVSKSALHPETVKQLKDANYQNIILPEALDARIANKESFFQYYYSSTCSHCKNTTPILISIQEELGVQVSQFNLQEFNTSWGKYKVEATPTLIYYKDGVEADRLVGGYSTSSETGNTTEDFKNFFVKHLSP